MTDDDRHGRLGRVLNACRALTVPAGRHLIRINDTTRKLALRVPEPARMRIGRACRRCGRLSLEVCTGFIVVGLVALALVYGRLSQGPIKMGFVVATVEKSVNGQLRGPSIDIGDALVRLSENGGIEFRLTQVRLFDRDGVVVAEAPFASVGLSGRALLAGKLAAGSVDLIGPRVLLHVRDDDSLSLTVDSRSGDVPPARDPSVGVKPPDSAGEQRQIALVPAVNELFHDLGAGENTSSYLSSFGIRDAEFFVAREDRVTRWRVRAFEVDLERRDRQSVLLGRASVGSDERAWDMTFEVAQLDGYENLSLGMRVENLVPRELGTEFAALSPLRGFDLPVTAALSAELGRDGRITAASGQFALGAGRLFAPWNEQEPASIDSGTLGFSYSEQAGRFELKPSALRWGQSHVAFAGEVIAASRPEAAASNAPRDWSYRFATTDIALAAEEFGLPAIPIDAVSARGTLRDRGQTILLDSFRVQAADAFLALNGRIEDAPHSPALTLTGEISPMPVAFLKLIWPKFIAPGAREWVGESVGAGHITGGEIAVNIPGGVLARLESGGDLAPESVDVRFGTDKLRLSYIAGMPEILTGAGGITLRGRRFLFNVPEARIDLPDRAPVTLQDAQFVIGDLRENIPSAEINFRVTASADAAYHLINHDPLNYAGALGLEPKDLGGDLSGAFGLVIPLLKDLDFPDIGIRGRATLKDPAASGLAGDFSVAGGELVFDVNDKALLANGIVMVNGVPVDVEWHRIFGAPDDKQPGLRLHTALNEGARKALGLAVNHVVRGVVPVALNITHDDSGHRVRVEADLTASELFFVNVAARKPPGENAILTFDIIEDSSGLTVLQDIRLIGDDLAVAGSITIGRDGLPSAFDFPTFSPGLLTRLRVSGIRDARNIWRVEAEGDTYDGREFFRSLFSKGKLSEDQPERPEEQWGVEIKARISTVLGYNDTSVSNLTAHIRKDAGEISELSVNGRLAGEAPLAIRLRKEPGEPRYLLAEATDAGAAFRLVGLYSRMTGGETSLRVNLDGLGDAERIGTLYAWNFAILGDEVVDQVLFGDDTDINRPARRQARPGKRRSQIDFNTMRIAFSVGNGQFLLRDAVINGPLLGATMRGAIDMNRDRIKLSGTYVPVYGLNAAIGSVPILGDLLTGRSGEGIFGMTFAVRGAVDNPEVLVNPVSAVAPGFLRQIFEFDQAPPRIIPDEQRSSRAGSARAPSSSTTR